MANNGDIGQEGVDLDYDEYMRSRCEVEEDFEIINKDLDSDYEVFMRKRFEVEEGLEHTGKN